MKADIDYHERGRRFVFDGRMLDREPHLKIDDHTAPTEVGRIYFALDTDGRRLVVEFFGVKDDRPTAQAAACAARQPPRNPLPRRPPWRRSYGR